MLGCQQRQFKLNPGLRQMRVHVISAPGATPGREKLLLASARISLDAGGILRPQQYGGKLHGLPVGRRDRAPQLRCLGLNARNGFPQKEKQAKSGSRPHHFFGLVALNAPK